MDMNNRPFTIDSKKKAIINAFESLSQRDKNIAKDLILDDWGKVMGVELDSLMTLTQMWKVQGNWLTLYIFTAGKETLSRIKTAQTFVEKNYRIINQNEGTSFNLPLINAFLECCSVCLEFTQSIPDLANKETDNVLAKAKEIEKIAESTAVKMVNKIIIISKFIFIGATDKDEFNRFITLAATSLYSNSRSSRKALLHWTSIVNTRSKNRETTLNKSSIIQLIQKIWNLQIHGHPARIDLDLDPIQKKFLQSEMKKLVQKLLKTRKEHETWEKSELNQ